MKNLQLLAFVPVALVLNLFYHQATYAEIPVIEVSRSLKTDPMIVNGQSGGNVASNCGNITDAPTQVIQVKESLPYLRLTVEGQGKPTLLIDGPGGRFCVLADNYTGGKPELAGFWQPGRYLVYIGELIPGKHKYTLSISVNKN
ncbi:hypothetical protein B6N60_03611 [Richelia sinica FACHB-800]|uniref:Uncharacterized protein n=1 Tax=Richelia sinica FACHB-800 TaxID=1357546 RepID=A0A975Y645_9NOST|nr:hypothetical protein [Richelia sinica]MBD2664006.1 hypothetical protein [Richelia sinica FACHB-800]QXE24901.1 hypothetical protein B6N60_03611 [Richelia sinica FACHB-800]